MRTWEMSKVLVLVKRELGFLQRIHRQLWRLLLLLLWWWWSHVSVLLLLLYRQMRRKEQDRLARMDADYQRRKEMAEFTMRREERMKAAEERTVKSV